MTEPYLGQICSFGFNFAPRGWATCSGQILPIQQNTALFSLLGTSYGGNGTTTFALPDLRSRVGINQGQGPGLSSYVIGEQTGTENVTLLSTQMPMHNHLVGVNSSDSGATAKSPASNYVGYNAGGPLYAPAGDGSTLNPQAVGLAGGNQPFSVLQPLLCINFCIALQGIFPSRN
jgi:microcystin-dependent protein